MHGIMRMPILVENNNFKKLLSLITNWNLGSGRAFTENFEVNKTIRDKITEVGITYL